MRVISDERPVSRKHHKCMMCFRQIGPGERYHRQRVVDSDDAWTWKNCAHCDVFTAIIWDALSEYYDAWDEGISWSTAREFEPSNLHEARLKVYWIHGWRRRDGSLRPIPDPPTKLAAT